VETPAAKASGAIEAALPELVAVAEAIHAHPELAFEEHHSAALVADALEAHGFEVARGIAELPTAFEARVGDGSLCVVLVAEYDALPGVGHACGHNLIAASALGAAIGLKEVATELGLTLKVIGTPAEEAGGGKVLLLEAGVFDHANLAMMVHPWSFDRLESQVLAVDQFEVRFHGRTAHASAAPHEGINAADAMTVAQVAIGLLRQQLAPGDQVHGVVLSGGSAANVIPDEVVAQYMCRSRTIEGLRALRPRIDACFEAGSLATGASLEMNELGASYSHLDQDRDLLARFRRHAESRGRRFDADDDEKPKPCYSTDMGNISLVVPSIHPLLGLETEGAVNHQPEFAASCVGASAERLLLDASISLCLTAIDAATEPELRRRFEERR
jgi:amidohydrolase